MRIFYAVHDHSWEDSNLLEGLRQSGHEVEVYRPGHAFHEALSPDWTPADRRRVSERLVDAVRSAHKRRQIDVFFGYFLKQLLYPQAIRDIRDLGILTLNYWCNGAHQFHLVDEISPAFDYCVATERSSLANYQRVGARPIYLQMAANPAIYQPYDLPLEFDVTFVGQRYADRPEYLRYLLEAGIDVRAWGPGWAGDRRFGEKSLGLGVNWRYLLRHPRAGSQKLLAVARSAIRKQVAMPPWAERRISKFVGPSLPLESLTRMYSRTRISLGFSTCGDAVYRDRHKIRQIHLRDFEAPMSGALHLVEFQEELREFYDLDKEIVCYASREELLDKVRFYLAHPAAAQRIREQGLLRARRDHTWVRRFDQLFSGLGLPTGSGCRR